MARSSSCVLVLIAPIADCRLVPIDECELEGAAFNVGFAASILLMWSTAVGRNDSSANGSLLASNLQRRPSGDDSEGSAVATRPIPASRVAPKQPDSEPSPLLLRFYEAAVRDLTHPAINSKSPTTARRRFTSRWFELPMCSSYRSTILVEHRDRLPLPPQFEAALKKAEEEQQRTDDDACPPRTQ